MFPLLTIPLALAVPALEGALALRLLEGDAPVLSRLERACAGFFLGGAGSAFVLFFAVLAGVPLTFGGFLTVHVALLGTLAGVVVWRFPRFRFPPSPALLAPPLSPLLRGRDSPTAFRVLLCLLVAWTAFKIAAGGYDLLLTPSYFDDTYANWNMRAKAFFVSESLLLDLPRDDDFFFGGRVQSYPLTVYFAKVWIAMNAGGWNEHTVNSIHFLWFLAFLVLFFCAVLREAGGQWAVLGTYVLVSLPLYLVHGTSAYTDVLMSAHLFLVLFAFFRWIQETDLRRRRSWFLLFSASAAAMVFVKNEAMLLFLPPLTLLVAGAAWWRERDLRRACGSAAPYVLALALITLPWVGFKVLYGLGFGNANKVTELALMPHAGVPSAIFNDLLYTGSYLLLFPAFLLILALTHRFWRRHAVGLLLLFLAVVFIGQFSIYYLTPLAIEAIRHTGFGRGMVQLLPTFVFSAVLLIQNIVGTRIMENERPLPSPG